MPERVAARDPGAVMQTVDRDSDRSMTRMARL